MGDVWTWTAIYADTKLDSRSWLVGDGHKCYVETVEAAFGSEVDFAQLVKRPLRRSPLQPHRLHRRQKIPIMGNPKPQWHSNQLR